MLGGGLSSPSALLVLHCISGFTVFCFIMCLLSWSCGILAVQSMHLHDSMWHHKILLYRKPGTLNPEFTSYDSIVHGTKSYNKVLNVLFFLLFRYGIFNRLKMSLILNLNFVI